MLPPSRIFVLAGSQTSFWRTPRIVLNGRKKYHTRRHKEKQGTISLWSILLDHFRCFESFPFGVLKVFSVEEGAIKTAYKAYFCDRKPLFFAL